MTTLIGLIAIVTFLAPLITFLNIYFDEPFGSGASKLSEHKKPLLVMILSIVFFVIAGLSEFWKTFFLISMIPSLYSMYLMGEIEGWDSAAKVKKFFSKIKLPDWLKPAASKAKAGKKKAGAKAKAGPSKPGLFAKAKARIVTWWKSDPFKSFFSKKKKPGRKPKPTPSWFSRKKASFKTWWSSWTFKGIFPSGFWKKAPWKTMVSIASVFLLVWFFWFTETGKSWKDWGKGDDFVDEKKAKDLPDKKDLPVKAVPDSTLADTSKTSPPPVSPIVRRKKVVSPKPKKDIVKPKGPTIDFPEMPRDATASDGKDSYAGPEHKTMIGFEIGSSKPSSEKSRVLK